MSGAGEEAAYYRLPLVNAIVFHALSSISILVCLAALASYGCRALEAAPKPERLKSVLSPFRNPYFFQLVMFLAGTTYHLSRIIYTNGVLGFQGSSLLHLEGFRAATWFPTTLSICMMVLGFATVLTTLFINLKVFRPRQAARLVLYAQRFGAFAMSTALLALVVLNAILRDFQQLRGWTNIVQASAVSLTILVVLPQSLLMAVLLIQQLRLRKTDTNSNAGNALAKLLVAAVFGCGASTVLIAAVIANPRQFALNSLLVTQAPEVYAVLVKDIRPFLDLTNATYVYSISGSAAALPFLLAPSNLAWLRKQKLFAPQVGEKESSKGETQSGGPQTPVRESRSLNP